MNWIDRQVSLYKTHSDNYGSAATFRQILLTRFADNLQDIIDLRKIDTSVSWVEYKNLCKPYKEKLQAFTPAALLECKAKNRLKEFSRSGIMQMDFDGDQIEGYDLEGLKKWIFQLKFIGFCGLSSTGRGFYALAEIAEPDKLEQYYEHVFDMLLAKGIKMDDSKGKKVENLRYVSYDSKMLIRENPEPLRIKHFKPKPARKKLYAVKYSKNKFSATSGLVRAQLKRIKEVKSGARWKTTQQVSFTLGGKGDRSILKLILNEINNNPEFNGSEEKYSQCAEVCFEDGMLNPLKSKYD